MRLLFTILLLITCLTFPYQANAQINSEQEAVNLYVDYLNENIHGIFIVQRLLELLNQDVNEYVNLEKQQLNLISNSDFPKDIFEDPNGEFFDISPRALYHQLKALNIPSTPLFSGLKVDLDRINKKTKQINAIRFEIEDYINEHDLTDRTQLISAYEKFENAVVIIEEYRKLHDALYANIYENNIRIARSTYQKSLLELHREITSLAYSIRSNSPQNVKLYRDAVHGKMNELSLESSQNTIATSINRMIHIADDFINQVAVPSRYTLYGLPYYYYNYQFCAQTNKYSKALIRKLNADLEMIPLSKFVELPHYFKVIYPQPLEELNDIPFKPTKPLEIPERLLDRKVSDSGHIIVVESKTIRLGLYDHEMIDYDSISVNFNGRWILEGHKLTSDKKHIDLSLLPGVDNILIIHAHNEGMFPPNTVAIRYSGSRRYGGDLIINSSMLNSEMIRIRVE